MDVRAELTQAYTTYVTALQEAVSEQQTEIAEAYGRYIQAMRAAAEEQAGRDAAEAFADYNRAIRDAMGSDRGHARTDELHTYASAVKRVIERADAVALDPVTLALLAHQTGTAAWLSQREDAA
jgi:hypothetical protein